MAATAVGALALGTSSASAQSQSQGGPLRIVEAPVIHGTPVVGQTLTAGGGSWSSPKPQETEAGWDWWGCPSASFDGRCTVVSRAPTLLLESAMVGSYVHLRRYVEYKRQRIDEVTNTAAGPVTTGTAPAPAPSPVPSPTPEPAPVPAPVPGPVFDTAAVAPAPVPVTAPVLRESGSRRVITPFPVVRMRGRLTPSGARVTVLSVRAPRSAKVLVRCKGDCPVRRWTPRSRKTTVTRARAFERNLRAGTLITVFVTRAGYVGKRTTFLIRRGSPPRRSDVCLSARGRVARCPSS